MHFIYDVVSLLLASDSSVMIVGWKTRSDRSGNWRKKWCLQLSQRHSFCDESFDEEALVNFAIKIMSLTDFLQFLMPEKGDKRPTALQTADYNCMYVGTGGYKPYSIWKLKAKAPGTSLGDEGVLLTYSRLQLLFDTCHLCILSYRLSPSIFPLLGNGRWKPSVESQSPMVDIPENQKSHILHSGFKKSSENGKKKGNMKLAGWRLAADDGNHPWNV